LRYVTTFIRPVSALIGLSVCLCSSPLSVHAETAVDDGLMDRAAVGKILQSARAAQEASEKAAAETQLLLKEAKAERAAAEKAAAAALAIEVKIEKYGAAGGEAKHPRLKLAAITAIGGLAATGTVLGIVALSRTRGPSNNLVNSTTFSQTIRNLQLTPGPQGPPGPPGRNGINGLMGLTGQPGRNGVNGLMGLTGPSGQNGLIGARGANGLNGPQGPAGMNGTLGVPGPTGLPGPTGPTGPQGPQGPQGLPGPAG